MSAVEMFAIFREIKTPRDFWRAQVKRLKTSVR